MNINQTFYLYCYTGPNIPISRRLFKDMEECIDHCIRILNSRNPSIPKESAIKEVHVISVDITKCPKRFKIFTNDEGIHVPRPKIAKIKKKNT